MPSKPGRIVGDVTYREGDGQEIAIPQGPCDITVTDLDATISWVDDDSHGATALPLGEYNRYISRGAIVLDKPPAEGESAPRSGGPSPRDRE